MLSEFKITFLRDSSFTTRLGRNRIQNRTEPIPLIEIYESEIRRLRAENEFLKMQYNAIAIQLNAALAQLHKKCDIANFTLVFAFKQNNDDKRNKSHRKVWDLLSFIFIVLRGMHIYATRSLKGNISKTYKRFVFEMLPFRLRVA